MALDDLINKIKSLVAEEKLENKTSFAIPYKQDEEISVLSENILDSTFDIDSQILNWTSQYYTLFENSVSEWKITILFFYILIILVSFFGNSIVCKIVFGNSAMRSTTNIYIGNLSISDLLMTILNIPLQMIQILSRNWPFNQFLCKSLPFFQGLSVNISSFTMACIALDRYQVIAHPLKPRVSMSSIIIKITCIWVIAIMVSCPYPALADIENEIAYIAVTRCRLIYPDPKIQFRQSLTIIVTITQYVVPLSITGITYYKICCIIWNRKFIGVVSESQRNQRYLEKWKTIKMLVIVFIVFAVCWFPLNMYHIYQDFTGVVRHNKHNPVIFLICHWFAMSSVCYNPFVYCWFNESFRALAKTYVWYILRLKPEVHVTLNSSLKNKDLSQRNYKQSRKLSTMSVSIRSKYSYGSRSLAQQLSTEIVDVNQKQPTHKLNWINKLKLHSNSFESNRKLTVKEKFSPGRKKMTTNDGGTPV